jgi:hypothetical protein
MKLVHVRIQGSTPLLQHRWSEAAEQDPGHRAISPNNKTPREVADGYAYKTKDGKFYHPGAAISRLLREAGSGHKIKGRRKSAKFIVPAAVIVLDDAVILLNGKSPIKDFEVDSRPVTNPFTKGKIMCHRPRFDEWSAEFTIRINEDILTLDFVHTLLTEGGAQIGIGPYRPEKGGPFGTFQVTKWEEKK